VHPTLAGSRSPVVGTRNDPLALVLRHGAQEGIEASTYGRRQIQMGLVEHLDDGTQRVDALDMWTPSIIDRVARSHSATSVEVPVNKSRLCAARSMLWRNLMEV
jgi:hypothetical protein